MKNNIPPTIRTIYTVYVPLLGEFWLHSVGTATREGILAGIKPKYP